MEVFNTLSLNNSFHSQNDGRKSPSPVAKPKMGKRGSKKKNNKNVNNNNNNNNNFNDDSYYSSNSSIMRPHHHHQSLSPLRHSHPFGVPDERGRLSLSDPSSRSNSSNSLTPSARSSASNDSYMSFPLISPADSRAASSRSGQHHYHNGRRSLSSPLPELRPAVPEVVDAYDKLVNRSVAHFVNYSGNLGQDPLRQATMVKSLFEIQREFILISTGAEVWREGAGSSSADKKTADINPLGSGPAQAAKMRDIKNFAGRHAYSPYAPHLHFVADTIGALGWVVAGDRPSHFIRESYAGGKHHVKHIPGMGEQVPVMSTMSADDGRASPRGSIKGAGRSRSPARGGKGAAVGDRHGAELVGSGRASNVNVRTMPTPAAPPGAPLTTEQVKLHTGWVNAWQNVILDLDSYVRNYHPRGLKWKKSN